MELMSCRGYRRNTDLGLRERLHAPERQAVATEHEYWCLTKRLQDTASPEIEDPPSLHKIFVVTGQGVFILRSCGMCILSRHHIRGIGCSIFSSCFRFMKPELRLQCIPLLNEDSVSTG